MKAVVIHGKEARFVTDRPLPMLRDDYILVKTHAVALNPTDWKHIAYGRAMDGALIGCDFAGIVEQVGSSVSKQWKKGDKICGVVHGSNLVQPEDGAFAEYIVAKGDVQMRKPEHLSYAQASTVALGAITCGQGLYQKGLRLELPTRPVMDKEYVLIYGGSTSVGGLAVQFATLSGYSVITICDANQFGRLRGLGADHCFDYHNASTGYNIRQLTDNGLRYAMDTIANEASASMCADALWTYGGARYCATNPTRSPRDDVESIAVVMYTMMGEDFNYGGTHFPASQEDYEFAKRFMTITENLLAEGKLKTHPEVVGKGGLAGVADGLRQLQEGKVRSGKLVYEVSSE